MATQRRLGFMYVRGGVFALMGVLMTIGGFTSLWMKPPLFISFCATFGGTVNLWVGYFFGRLSPEYGRKMSLPGDRRAVRREQMKGLRDFSTIGAIVFGSTAVCGIAFGLLPAWTLIAPVVLVAALCIAMRDLRASGGAS